MIELKLYAPPKYWQLPESTRREIVNGCGPRNIIGDLVPDSVWGLSITEGCNIHDYMYRIGETEADKDEADKVFLNNMIRIVEARTRCRLLKRLRLWRVQIYYHAVANFGGPAFWSGKNAPESEGLALA